MSNDNIVALYCFKYYLWKSSTFKYTVNSTPVFHLEHSQAEEAVDVVVCSMCTVDGMLIWSHFILMSNSRHKLQICCLLRVSKVVVKQNM